MDPPYSKIEYWDDKTIVVINKVGKLRRLHVPFRAVCILQAGNIKPDTWIFVEQVAPNKQYKILYRILSIWVPYHHFRIIIHF
jgi:hypothetical protein